MTVPCAPVNPGIRPIPRGCWLRPARGALPTLAVMLLVLSPERAVAGEPDAVPGSSAYRAVDDGWLPGPGVPTAWRGAPASGFDGIEYLSKVRLHLRLGGFVDGGFGGARFEPTGGEVKLVLLGRTLEIDLALVDGVSPLSAPSRVVDGVPLPALPLSRELSVRYELRPTWRSHLGVGLSALLPGAGMFIQESEREFGFLYLGLGAFFASSGVFALVGPSQQAVSQRRALSGVLFGFGVGNSVISAIHAFQSGRRPTPVGPRAGSLSEWAPNRREARHPKGSPP